MKKLLLLFVLIIAALAYWPGLQGELIFDDRHNLSPVGQWLDGEISWQKVVFGNISGPLGRPLSMLSFVINAAVTGGDVWGFKLGNLILHLATSVILFFFLRGLALRDRNFHAIAGWIALAVTAIWLLHPLLVSTVLYVVQRMAILSAMFVLATLLAYLHGRNQIEQGQSRSGGFWIFAAVPILTVLASLSKENGLLAPMLCGVLEWVYFPQKDGKRRPWQARTFVAAGVAFPIIAAASILLLHPDFYFSGYTNRAFGPVERLLTQTRVLFDYIGSILAPAGPQLSLFRENYSISTGLFSPLATLFAGLGWCLIAGLAFYCRKTIPGFTAGIGIFLVGHAMESTIFPLLIYFEHRNYLPAIGIIWAAVSLLVVGGRQLASRVDHPRTIVAAGTGLLLVALAAATYSRSLVWQSNELLVQQSLQHYPDSRHLRLQMQQIEMQRPTPNVTAARSHAEHLLTIDRSSTRLVGYISLLILDCAINGEAKPDIIQQALKIRPDTLESDLYHKIVVLANNVLNQNCENLAPVELADGIVVILDNSVLPDSNLWKLRYLAARLYIDGDNIEAAHQQAAIAWKSNPRSLPVGMMLTGLRISLGQFDKAEALLDTIAPRIPRYEEKGQALAESYRRAIDDQSKEYENDEDIQLNK